MAYCFSKEQQVNTLLLYSYLYLVLTYDYLSMEQYSQIGSPPRSTKRSKRDELSHQGKHI